MAHNTLAQAEARTGAAARAAAAEGEELRRLVAAVSALRVTTHHHIQPKIWYVGGFVACGVANENRPGGVPGQCVGNRRCRVKFADSARRLPHPAQLLAP